MGIKVKMTVVKMEKVYTGVAKAGPYFCRANELIRLLL